jgi:D-aminopeptidase
MNWEQAVADLPRAYPGPGGAVAVLRDGETLVRHAWGWANAERRIAFRPDTLFRMCSITKQFTCALALETFPDLSALDDDVRARLPRLEAPAPPALRLAHNQSGLRDYWAVAMLMGSAVEAPFGDTEAGRIVASTRTLQFASGTRFSYCNQNFRLLSDILQDRTGRSFGEMLRTVLFDRAGMATALLASDTRALPDGTEGYEGNPVAGFRAAVNRIQWTGDAGLAASLDDMIAWERFIDATRDDVASPYAKLCAPASFADGAAAAYGFGVARRMEFGRLVTGHGGALRGWRSHRLYVPAERLSIVVMFNHLSDAQAAALDLLAAVLGETRARPNASLPAPAWLGAYIEPQTGLAARVEAAGAGEVLLRYGHSAERLALQPDGSAGRDATRLYRATGGLWMDRPVDRQISRLVPVNGALSLDVAGVYRCDELDAELTVVDAGGVLYGAFSGALGQGSMELLVPIAEDLCALPCPRALDHTPPGDWTLSFARDANRRVQAATVGCWLARGLTYAKRS